MHRPHLNHRQERFVFEYLKDQNASAAALRAGYSARTKGTHAAALLRHPLVEERIRLGLADLYAGLNITAVSLLRQQARAAFFDPGKLFDAAGEPIPLGELDEEVRAVLTVHYEARKNGDWVRRVRQPGRAQALAALERRYAQFLALQTEKPAWREEMERMEEMQPVAAEPAAPPKKKPVFASHFFDDRPAHRAEAPPPAPAAAPAAHMTVGSNVLHGAHAAHRADGAIESAAPREPGGMEGRSAPNERPEPEEARDAMKRDHATRGADAVPAIGAVPVADAQRAGAGAAMALADAWQVRAGARQGADAEMTRDAHAAASTHAVSTNTASARTRSTNAPCAAPAPATPAEEPYDFRKDPNWMWGGRVRPKPAPEPEPPQPVASLPPNFRLRPGAVVPAAYPPGYNPPWLRRDRPQYAETGSVFGDD